MEYLSYVARHSGRLRIRSLIKSKADGTIQLDSADERRIFAGLLFFEIRRSPADFLDLEQSRKLTQWSPDDCRQETVWPPADFLWK